MNSNVKVERRTRRRRGAAMILTLFTVAALLALGTTFIGIAIGESRQSGSEIYAQASREAAGLGVNWALSYMAWGDHWFKDTANKDPNNLSTLYLLTDPSGGRPSLSGPHTWMRRTFWYGLGRWDPATRSLTTSVPERNFTLFLGYSKNPQTDPDPLENDKVLQLSPASDGYAATCVISVERLVAGQDTYLWGQATNYNLKAQATLYRAGNLKTVLAGRTVIARVEPNNFTQYGLYQSNMRSWDAPGINTNAYFAPTQEQNDINRFNSGIDAIDDQIVIAKGYKLDADIRADGVVGDASIPSAIQNVSGNVKIDATDTELNNRQVQFNGSSSFTANNVYTANGRNDGNSKVFPTDRPPKVKSTQGLPPTENYLETFNNGDASKKVGSYGDLARNNVMATRSGGSDTYNGHIKVGSTTLTKVDATTNAGFDMEYVDGQPDPPAPAKVKVTFNNDGTVTFKKYGAYTGKEVTPTGIFAAGPVTIKDQALFYVDGGNVEVEGTVPKGVTIVAGASTDRPTVDSTGHVVNYKSPAVMNALKSTTVYAPATDNDLCDAFSKPRGSLSWPRDADGKITGPVTVDGRPYWPAWDPDTVTKAGGDVMNISPLVREGNLTVTGNLTKTSTTTGAVGLIAQNTIYLSDQNNTTDPATGQRTLEVNAALMSFQHSVQFGGFITNSGSGMTAHWKNIGTRNILNRTMKNAKGQDVPLSSIPKPSGTVTNGKFVLNGSVLGKFGDVEGTTTGVGYTTQQFTQDQTMKSAPPPFFPQFERKTGVKLMWLVRAWSDAGAMREVAPST